MRTIFAVLFAFIAVCVISTEASAQDRIVRSVFQQELNEIVTSQGHTIVETASSGDPSVTARTAEGLIFLLYGTACNANGVAGCQGVMMQILYETDERVNYERVSQANYTYAAIATWWDQQEGTVGFTRYVVLDGGVTFRNLQENLGVLIGVAPLAAEIVFP
jgi:hypothetical protein